MGMDCNGYFLVRVPTEQDIAQAQKDERRMLPEGSNLCVTNLSLTREEHEELNRMLEQEFPGEQSRFVNTDKLEADFNIPAHYYMNSEDYDLTQAKGWVKYSSWKKGEDSILLEVDSANYLYTDGLYDVLAVVQCVSHLRKPFSRDRNTPTARIEGDTPVPTSENPVGADVSALKVLLGTELKRYCKALLPSNMELAKALRAHAGKSSEWDTAVIDVLKNPLGIVFLDW